jgi:hypothetical protein
MIFPMMRILSITPAAEALYIGAGELAEDVPTVSPLK